jgi:hypothetical protein
LTAATKKFQPVSAQQQTVRASRVAKAATLASVVVVAVVVQGGLEVRAMTVLVQVGQA